MLSNHQSSFIPFSSSLQSCPALGSFQMSHFFTSGGQSIGISASASVLPMNIQDWFPLGWTGWISLLSKGLSSIFFSTTFQKHQFFSAQPSLWSNSHIHTWVLTKAIPLTILRWYRTCLQCGRPRFDSWVGKIPWRRKWQPTRVLLPGKFHGLRGSLEPGRLQSMGSQRVGHDWANGPLLAK